MSRHRAEPSRRHAAPPGRRRAEQVRPRYGRLAVLGASVSVTGIAMLGGIGVLPSVADESGDDPGATHGPGTAAIGAVTQEPEGSPDSASGPSEAAPAGSPDGVQDDQEDAGTRDLRAPVPAGSGEGRRIVFDQSDQRVWLVSDDGTVERTYLVSGSLTDNLQPGTYSVYSRSEHAFGVDDSGTMQYFVRFTEGTNGAAIGFHDIPVLAGHPVQTVAQLGTPQSHGCIRQLRKDAIALWDFAPVGTEVDVTA